MADVIAISPLADVDRRLKAELQVLRRKGAIRSTDWDSGSSSGGSDSRSCSRCRSELGRIINRGAFCRACRLRVCKACREYSTRSTDWVCTICHKHMEIQSATGEWMNEYVRRPSRRRDNRVYVPPSDVIKRSIRRSWTISNPSPRWSSLRGSAELRAYSSLPRHQDHPPNLQLSPILKKRSSSPQARRLPSIDSVDSGLPLSPVLKNTPRGSNENVRSRSSLIPVAQRHSEALTHQQKRSLFSTDSGVESLNSQDECSKPSVPTYHRRSLISEGINRNSEEVRSNQRRSLEESPNIQRRSLVGDGMNRTSEEIRLESPGFQRRPLISDGINRSLDESPNFPRRSLITDGINRNSAEIRQESPYLQRRPLMGDGPSVGRHSLITEGINRTSEESPFCQRRSLQRRQQVEYSGTSDSGGGTPPGARKREEFVQEDVEVPCVGTVFRKVTVKRRRQDTRRLLENGSRSRRTRDSVRVTEHCRTVTEDPNATELLLRDTEGDDYKLVFISSTDSSSKEEEFSLSDTSSTSSQSSQSSTPGFSVDDCDWDYFESSSMSNRPVLRDWNWTNRRSSPANLESGQSTNEDSPIPPRRLLYNNRKRDCELDPPSSKSSSEWSILEDSKPPPRSQPPTPEWSILEDSLRRRCTGVESTSREWNLLDDLNQPCSARDTNTGGTGRPLQVANTCAVQEQSLSARTCCNTCGASPVLVPIPIPVPIPAALWPLQQDSTLADIVYSAERDGNGSIRIKIRSLRSGNAPWCLVPVQVTPERGGGGRGDNDTQIVYEIVNDDKTREGVMVQPTGGQEGEGQREEVVVEVGKPIEVILEVRQKEETTQEQVREQEKEVILKKEEMTEEVMENNQKEKEVILKKEEMTEEVMENNQKEKEVISEVSNKEEMTEEVSIDTKEGEKEVAVEDEKVDEVMTEEDTLNVNQEILDDIQSEDTFDSGVVITDTLPSEASLEVAVTSTNLQMITDPPSDSSNIVLVSHVPLDDEDVTLTLPSGEEDRERDEDDDYLPRERQTSGESSESESSHCSDLPSEGTYHFTNDADDDDVCSSSSSCTSDEESRHFRRVFVINGDDCDDDDDSDETEDDDDVINVIDDDDVDNVVLLTHRVRDLNAIDDAGYASLSDTSSLERLHKTSDKIDKKLYRLDEEDVCDNDDQDEAELLSSNITDTTIIPSNLSDTHNNVPDTTDSSSHVLDTMILSSNEPDTNIQSLNVPDISILSSDCPANISSNVPTTNIKTEPSPEDTSGDSDNAESAENRNECEEGIMTEASPDSAFETEITSELTPTIILMTNQQTCPMEQQVSSNNKQWKFERFKVDTDDLTVATINVENIDYDPITEPASDRSSHDRLAGVTDRERLSVAKQPGVPVAHLSVGSETLPCEDVLVSSECKKSGKKNKKKEKTVTFKDLSDTPVEEESKQKEPEVVGKKNKKKKLARKNSKEKESVAEERLEIVPEAVSEEKSRGGKKGKKGWVFAKESQEKEEDLVEVNNQQKPKQQQKKKKRFGKWGNKRNNKTSVNNNVTSSSHVNDIPEPAGGSEVWSEISVTLSKETDRDFEPNNGGPLVDTDSEVLYFDEEEGDEESDEDSNKYKSLPSFVRDFLPEGLSIKKPEENLKNSIEHLEGVPIKIPEECLNKNLEELPIKENTETLPERYTSLVMITQEAPSYPSLPGSVSVVTSDTTKLVDDTHVIVRHTNWQDEDVHKSLHMGLAGYFTLTLENSGSTNQTTNRRPLVTKSARIDAEEDVKVMEGDVKVVTGGDTMSQCLEEGLADDDSWVEDVDERAEDEFATTTPTDSSSGDEAVVTTSDREEELRGYHRAAIDFTLHTIVEESCEESEAETDKKHANKKSRPLSASELEKYFFFGLGGLENGSNVLKDDSCSECSSLYSEGLESLGNEEGVNEDGESQQAEELASSRLEKYFLSGFMGFSGSGSGGGGGGGGDSDGSGSVGSDSEGGRPSPEQRRKRLVRARGTGRQHSNSNSLDNLTQVTDEQPLEVSESSSTETDDLGGGSFSTDGTFDTVKRKKKKHRGSSSTPEIPNEEELAEDLPEETDERNKTPQPEPTVDLYPRKQQSRDSGFIGSCDDLLKEPTAAKVNDIKEEEPASKPSGTQGPYPPAVSLTRKDSFNNWSSDEETNLMMSKMRAFFKTMVAAAAPVVPTATSPGVTRAKTPSQKPPQLVYFENELTRLMKTVPGIKDEQVREIVEYLSSEDTWSDSYDSSDYTSSDLEGAVAYYQQTTLQRTELQEQISASCQQIINKFDTSVGSTDHNDDDTSTKDTALVYQRLVASFSKMANGDEISPHSSPPLLAKVMHHIGSRLVALMHEVSSPKIRPRRTPSTSTTTSEDDDLQLPRSQSHDLLLARPHLRSSSSGVSDQDERFSWRGSFESALLAGDSRTKLSAAKRRSAGDLASSNKNSREQLDRVRSCGSIGLEEKIWGRRRLSVPDSNASGASNDGDDDDDDEDGGDDMRSVTLPRSLQGSCAAGTNSLPRLPTSTLSATMHKSQSQQHVKSARYRPPGFSGSSARPTPPKRAVSAPGLHQRRGRRIQSNGANSEEKSISEELPTSPSGSVAGDWTAPEEDIDRLVAIHQHRTSLSSLGPRSDSMASVYSGAGESRYGTVTVRGEVEFALSYNYKTQALEVNVKQCRDLAPVDVKRNRSDPYVKVYLLPDKSKSGKRKTKVKKHTLNPVFDETLKFSVALDSLESRTLWLTVWHSDMFGRNDFLGEVMMSLENKVFDDPAPRFYHLNERTEPFDDLAIYKGDIIIGLKFVPPDVTVVKKGKRSRGSLHVLVKEAKNLTAVKAVGTSDPFCKCYLLPDKGRSSKQKTPVVRRNCSPVWNYTFTYDDVSLQELSERCLELTVWDHDRLASNEFLGGLRFSLGTGKHYGKSVDWMDANGKELQLWQRMLERPNFWVEGSIALRPSLEQRSLPAS